MNNIDKIKCEKYICLLLEKKKNPECLFGLRKVQSKQKNLQSNLHYVTSQKCSIFPNVQNGSIYWLKFIHNYMSSVGNLGLKRKNLLSCNLFCLFFEDDVLVLYSGRLIMDII